MTITLWALLGFLLLGCWAIYRRVAEDIRRAHRARVISHYLGELEDVAIWYEKSTRESEERHAQWKERQRQKRYY